jgi:ABC-type transport system involved in cytochrome c biogenesis permease subunit
MISTQIAGEEPTPGVEPMTQLIDAYAEEDPTKFNEAVQAQLAVVAAAAPVDYHPPSVRLERWLEATYSTMGAIVLYGLLLVLGILGVALDSPRLRSGVWWGVAVVAVVHTSVVLARVYITGRAPVINLYSSAVFIGLATVLAGLVFERIFRHGIGNLISTSTGMLSLMVASALNDGDTMPVLQAVLDTQFWLATHVITVTLGYAATFVAGGLGVIYLLVMAIGRQSQATLGRDVYRMAYAATCFGILFSFVGTVLGGLWADDSWGRFWGWDPKENGALLIVIWNALMLHARWDGMVRDRGFAILAVGGNIVTAWSWFGTNQLGLGLHAYGGASGAPLLLGLFLLSQLAIIGVGLTVVAKQKSRDAVAGADS